KLRMIRDVDGSGSNDVSPGPGSAPERSGMGPLGAADSMGEAWRTAAQDGHAVGDEPIFYLLRTGCPWRYLPRGVFPPRSTVYNIFRAFQRQGVWEAIWEELRVALRERLGQEASPIAGVIDSQSLKSRSRRSGL